MQTTVRFYLTYPDGTQQVEPQGTWPEEQLHTAATVLADRIAAAGAQSGFWQAGFTASGIQHRLAVENLPRFLEICSYRGINRALLTEKTQGARWNGSKAILDRYNLEFFVNPTTGERQTLHTYCVDTAEGYYVAAWTLKELRGALQDVYGDGTHYQDLCAQLARQR